MKKYFNTFIDNTANEFETIFISAGKVGYQIEINVKDIEKVIKVSFDNLVK